MNGELRFKSSSLFRVLIVVSSLYSLDFDVLGDVALMS